MVWKTPKHHARNQQTPPAKTIFTNKTLTSPVLNTGVSGSAILDEDAMGSNSATQLATQQSIKAYVDAQAHLSLIDEDNMATDSATRPPSQQSVKAYVDGQSYATITSYTNSTDNRVITSVDSSTINAEANLTFDGTTLAVTGTVEPSGDTASGDNAAIGYTSAEGLILTGQGSTNDVTIKNDADETVLSIPTGTTNVTVAGNLTASANETYDLGTSSLRWRDIYLSGNTIDLNGATISADGTGTISISASGASLPTGSKIGGRPLQTTAEDGVPERNVSFFTAVGGLVTAAATLIFKADVERKFTAFTLANGSSIGNPIQIFSF